MNNYEILKQALKCSIVDESVLTARAAMQERIALLKASNEIFAGVELSGDIVAFDTEKIAIA